MLLEITEGILVVVEMAEGEEAEEDLNQNS
jgi:hypothetical protein